MQNLPRTWQVPFAPGTLRAIATEDGKVAATDTLRTVGKAARIVLSIKSPTYLPVGTTWIFSRQRSWMLTASWFRMLPIS